MSPMPLASSPWRQLAVAAFVVVRGKTELLQVVGATHPRGRLTYLLDGGQ